MIHRIVENRLPGGVRTRAEVFCRPILEALIGMGGSAETGRVIACVERNMRGKLKSVDRGTLSDGKTLRWVNAAGWARKFLVDDGYLSKVSPRGVWEITEVGRKFHESGREYPIRK